jgi:hypothetical protein
MRKPEVLREVHVAGAVRQRTLRRATKTRVRVWVEGTNDTDEGKWWFWENVYKVEVAPKGHLRIEAHGRGPVTRETAERLLLDIADLRLTSERLYKMRSRKSA